MYSQSQYDRNNDRINSLPIRPQVAANIGLLNDRNIQNGRRNRDNDNLPVQNDYLQRYQINELQQANFGFNQLEQSRIDREMDKKRPTDGNLIERNRDDSILYGRFNPLIQPTNVMLNPVDTRKERFELTVNRDNNIGLGVGQKPTQIFYDRN